MPKSKKRKPTGRCTFKILRCRIHRKYSCPVCHTVDKKTNILISVPEYEKGKAEDCTWRGLQGSIQKHAQKFHGLTSNWRSHWTEIKTPKTTFTTNNPFTRSSRSKSQSQSQNPNVIEIESVDSDASNPDDPDPTDEVLDALSLDVLSQNTVIVEEEKVVVELEPPALEPEGIPYVSYEEIS